jgi:hypothetical protein
MKQTKSTSSSANSDADIEAQTNIAAVPCARPSKSPGDTLNHIGELNTRNKTASSPTNSDADFEFSEGSTASDSTDESSNSDDGGVQDIQREYCFGTPGRIGPCADWELTLIDAIDKAFDKRELRIKKGNSKWALFYTAINRDTNGLNNILNKKHGKYKKGTYKGFDEDVEITIRNRTGRDHCSAVCLLLHSF